MSTIQLLIKSPFPLKIFQNDFFSLPPLFLIAPKISTLFPPLSYSSPTPYAFITTLSQSLILQLHFHPLCQVPIIPPTTWILMVVSQSIYYKIIISCTAIHFLPFFQHKTTIFAVNIITSH